MLKTLSSVIAGLMASLYELVPQVMYAHNFFSAIKDAVGCMQYGQAGTLLVVCNYTF